MPAGEAAANEVHDFKPVARIQGSDGPSIAWDDFKVQLHGDPVGLHAQLLNQLAKRERG